ncbi:transcriptional regulator [Actinoplanes sp. Pm04-4]|uniref:Transcriptional regulator n=1 Tax=Paractinoplanes pyxinae TaxID=2997416 RepID=A0ABT4B795_9ACTN|nr:transcriptional regulator [Actinoplanes pyxinae]MCY1141478.1 transcriptional regulator [Actinoplanes pyxinae]
MRAALARHDLAYVFRHLSRSGFSQRRIGQLTEQSQSEISEIVGGRIVMAYPVLLRIADGLKIPRGYMGLGNYDREDHSPVEDALTVGVTGADEAEEIRRSLQHAAETMMGTSLPETDLWWQPLFRSRTPVPERVGHSDIDNLEHLTRILRAVDYQHGGGACREAVLAQTDYARSMLGSRCSDEVRRHLCLATADLHNLAGWSSFDVGLYGSARRHFALALEQAKANDNLSLAANVLYRLGRIHLHRGHIEQALRFFQLGQLAAQDADDPLTVAMLHANAGWAYALMGNDNKAISALGRAQHEFSRGEDDLPAWVAFFGAADLSALTGMIYAELCNGSAGSDNFAKAVRHLTQSIEGRGAGNTRSAVFELTALATARLKAGDNNGGIADGNRAVDMASQVRSVRTVDRLLPLLKATGTESSDEAAALARRIVTLRGG